MIMKADARFTKVSIWLLIMCALAPNISAGQLSVLSSCPDDTTIPIAPTAQVVIGGQTLIAGSSDKAANAELDCADSSIQHTILRCSLPPAKLSQALCLGRRIDDLTLNEHYQGEILNMSVGLTGGNSADDVIAQLEASLAKKPIIQYWADDTHLFASYIWVDGKAEVEVTKTIKGQVSDGRTRLYVSTLLGGLSINPQDAP